MPSDGIGQSRDARFVVADDPMSERLIGHGPAYGRLQVDLGQGRLAGDELDVGVDELLDGVFSFSVGMGVDRVDGLPDHREDGFVLGVEQVVEAPGPYFGALEDGRQGRTVETGASEQPASRIEDAVPGLQTG